MAPGGPRDPDEPDAHEGRPEPRVVAGTVVAILPRALYRLDVGGGQTLVAHAPGGPARHFVRLVVGDRVTVAVSVRDATRGRIIGRTERSRG
jgi:translation initiation factor IF-1